MNGPFTRQAGSPAAGDGDQAEAAAQLAARVAIGSAVSLLVEMGVLFAISYAIAHRYELGVIREAVVREWRRRRDPRRAERLRLTAELQRDLSDIEHGGGPDTTRIRGLYER